MLRSSMIVSYQLLHLSCSALHVQVTPANILWLAKFIHSIRLKVAQLADLLTRRAGSVPRSTSTSGELMPKQLPESLL